MTTALATSKSGSSNPTRLLLSVAVIGLLMLAVVEPAFAGAPTGGGTAGAATTRITSFFTEFRTILYGIGASILVAATMYVGYGLAWGGKKWSDVGNVAYGAGVAGLGPILVTWLFT
jgi:hypothetical protein